MAYKIDPDVLRKVARQVVGTPLEDRELITRAIEMLADEYPDLIDAAPGDWVGSKAGGILGKVRFLYFSLREYIVIFGSPTGAQGFSGRYKHVQIHKFLIAGRIDSYDLESDDTSPLPPLLPGEHTCLEKGHARGLTIHPGSWHIEYGRGSRGHHAAVRDDGHAAFVPRTRVCPQIYRRVRQVDPETDSPVTHRYRLRRPHPGVR
jgi:hypothetical protein